MQQRIIRQYYLLSTLFHVGSVQIISAMYVTFLMQNGLNLFEVNLVNASFYLTLFICEIPTGAFADIFGRKKAFVLACVLISMGMFTYGYSHTFASFVAAEIMLGIAMTFRSGAFQAWLVDNLKHHGHDGEFHQIFGREGLIKQVGGGISAVVGAHLAAKNPALPWLIGGTIATVTAVVAAIIMKEEYFTPQAFSWKRGISAMKEVAKTSIRYGMSDASVRFVLIVTSIFIFAMQPLNMYWQPFFRSHHVSEAGLGYVFIGMMSTLAIGAFIISRIRNWENEKKMILSAHICIGICILLAAISTNLPWALTFFLLHEIPRGMLGPLMDNYLQKRIPSHERASIVSFCAVAPHIGGAVGLVASGLVAESCGISIAWTCSATALIAGAILISQRQK